MKGLNEVEWKDVHTGQKPGKGAERQMKKDTQIWRDTYMPSFYNRTRAKTYILMFPQV